MADTLQQAAELRKKLEVDLRRMTEEIEALPPDQRGALEQRLRASIEDSLMKSHKLLSKVDELDRQKARLIVLSNITVGLTGVLGLASIVWSSPTWLIGLSFAAVGLVAAIGVAARTSIDSQLWILRAEILAQVSMLGRFRAPAKG
jgi:hypothetical protein